MIFGLWKSVKWFWASGTVSGPSPIPELPIAALLAYIFAELLSIIWNEYTYFDFESAIEWIQIEQETGSLITV